MAAATGIVAEMTKAFEIANVEMFAICLPDARVVAATSAVMRKWNCTREEIVGKQLVKFGTGPLSARHLTEDTPLGSVDKVEVIYVPPLGTTRSIRFTPQHCLDGEQKIMMLIGQHASVEEAENAIQNERRLSLALRSGGYAAWDHDYRTGETYNSPEMFDLLGFARDSKDLNYDTINDRVHPDDRDRTLDDQINGSPFGSDMFQTRYRVRNAQGNYVWIESIAGVIRSPVDGKPIKCVGLSRNIGDQMAALEKMQASERVLKRSQRAARLGSFTINAETAASRLSTEMIALIGMEDAIVQPNLSVFEKMIEGNDLEKFREAIELAKHGQNSPAFEIAYKTLVEGELNWFEVKIEADRNSQSQVDQIFGTCQCITERKLLERKFMQAQKMEAVGQLTGGVAHDFNNLLMVVLGNLQLVEQLVKGDERALKRIRAAYEAAERGSELTKRMLAFSRQQTLQNRDVDVNTLLDKMHGILGHAVGGTVNLSMHLGGNIWPIRADSTMLETAILNLSINARDAMKPKGGDITIETFNRTLDAETAADMEDVPPGDYVEIAVTDTGCGIPQENIEKVFQPFFTTKGPEAGSGLGLSMIYGFVKQSGGHIKIYSEVGHGTTMRIYLPRLKSGEDAVPAPSLTDVATAKPDAIGSAQGAAAAPSTIPPATEPAQSAPEPEAKALAATETQPPAPAAVSASRKPIVLVVEDNPNVRDVAAAMIEDMGYDVIMASNGVEGLKAIEERPEIDLVLSDVIMAGGLNGPEMALKALSVRPELKVLFMSGYAPGSLRQMQQELPNAIDLVNKPFTRNDLTEKVKAALAA
ncbi:MAG TPA: ATP-binding protein [Aestuariivirga sp.]|nr:ATP-binding protein [Aestuariivirga sp.]